MLYLTCKEILYMADYDFNSIFEQINNLKKPTTQTEEVCPEKAVRQITQHAKGSLEE